MPPSIFILQGKFPKAGVGGGHWRTPIEYASRSSGLNLLRPPVAWHHPHRLEQEESRVREVRHPSYLIAKPDPPQPQLTVFELRPAATLSRRKPRASHRRPPLHREHCPADLTRGLRHRPRQVGNRTSRTVSPDAGYRGPLRWDLAGLDWDRRRCTVSPVAGRVSQNIRVDRSRIALGPWPAGPAVGPPGSGRAPLQYRREWPARHR
jgi:hypothetical protein